MATPHLNASRSDPNPIPRVLGILAIVLLVLSQGVNLQAHSQLSGSSEGPSGATAGLNSAPRSQESGTSGPTVTILTPVNQSIITNGAPATLSFEVSNFNLTPPQGQPDQVGEGHAEIWVDGQLLAVVASTAPVQIPFADGPHSATVELVNNDGSSLTPAVSATTDFEMTHGPSTGTPQIIMWTPSTDSSVQGPEVLVSFTVYNFSIVTPVGQPNAPNEGHVHVFLDGLFLAMLTQEVQVNIPGVAPGTHTIRLLLVNNNHTPYLLNGSQEVAASASFTVFLPSSQDQSQLTFLTDLSMSILGVALLTLVAAVVLRSRPARTTPARPSTAARPTPETKAQEELDDRE